MHKFYLIALVFLLPALLYPQDVDDKLDYSEAIELIEVWLDAQKDFENIPGITAAVINDQEILWSGAVGESNIERNVASTSATIGSICSISKLFTAVSIMKLYDEGRLRLDDEIQDLLPWYNLHQQYDDSGPITVRALLTHSSGLPRESNHRYWTGPDFPFPTSDDVKSQLSAQETLYPASTYFQYSNLGLTLLGEIVEEVSGIPYEEYVQQYILLPLGLTNTRTELPNDLYGQQLAIGYSAMSRSRERERVQLFQANGITPAAGFSSTVEDLGRFASWQFRLLDTTIAEILKPATLKYMQQVHWTNPDWKTTWGLGFVVYKGNDGSKWVSHGGSCPGYRSTLQINPSSKRALSVIINASGTNPGKYARGINAIINKVKGKSKKADDKEKVMVKLSDYRGYYNVQPWGSEEYVIPWEGKLATISLPSDNPAKTMTMYKHIEGDTFRRIRDNDELGESMIFERNSEGVVYKFKTHDNYYSKMKRRL